MCSKKRDSRKHILLVQLFHRKQQQHEIQVEIFSSARTYQSNDGIVSTYKPFSAAASPPPYTRANSTPMQAIVREKRNSGEQCICKGRY